MQERGVRLFMTRMSPGNTNLLHARAHREVIRLFGRFPYRNEALGRHTTGREQIFLNDGGGLRRCGAHGAGQRLSDGCAIELNV